MTSRLFIIFCLVYLTWAKCPLDWGEYQGECLYLSREEREWVDAANHCRMMGAYLATDDSAEKHNTLTQLISLFHVYNEKTFWLGGDDYIFEGSWRWMETGSGIGPFTRWKAGSPTGNTTLNCLAMTWQGDELYWYDEKCTYYRIEKTYGGRHHYICEMP